MVGSICHEAVITGGALHYQIYKTQVTLGTVVEFLILSTKAIRDIRL